MRGVVCSTFTEACAQCACACYNDEELTTVVLKKTLHSMRAMSNKEFDLHALRTIIGILCCSKKTINVLDYGGAAGYHYHVAKFCLNNLGYNFKWAVVETKQMAITCKHAETSELSFFDTIDDAKKHLGSIDMVFSSGAIHYTEKPLKLINTLCNINAKYIFFTRTPFVCDNNTYCGVQHSLLSENGPGALPPEFVDRDIFYPFTFVPKEQAFNIMKNKYDLIFSTKEDDVCVISESQIKMFGFFGQAKEG